MHENSKTGATTAVSIEKTILRLHRDGTLWKIQTELETQSQH